MKFEKGRVPWIKGRHHSEETKQKLKGSHIGQMPWNKGKTGVYSEETIKKLSESHKGKHPSEETRKKMKTRRGEAHHRFGKHHAEEAKQKIREKHLGKHLTEIAKQKISKSLIGRKIPEETKQKIRNSKLGKKNPMYGASPWNKGKKCPELSGEKHHMWGKHHTPESIQKMRENNWMRGKRRSEEEKQKIRLATLKAWQNEEYAKKVLRSRPSGPELYLDFLLQNYFPDEWEFTGDGKSILHGLCPDFINRNGKKQIIELFGEYWHKKKKNIRYVQTEEGRKQVFAKAGFVALIIWDYELSDEKKVLKKIEEFVNEGSIHIP